MRCFVWHWRIGTNGNSYNELRSALGYHQKADDSGIVDSYKFVMERMKKLDSEAGAAINLDIANGLFMQRPSQLSKSYQSTVIFFLAIGLSLSSKFPLHNEYWTGDWLV